MNITITDDITIPESDFGMDFRDASVLLLRGARLSEKMDSVNRKPGKSKIPIDKYVFDDCCLMNDPCDMHKNLKVDEN